MYSFNKAQIIRSLLIELIHDSTSLSIQLHSSLTQLTQLPDIVNSKYQRLVSTSAITKGVL